MPLIIASKYQTSRKISHKKCDVFYAENDKT